MQTEWRSSQHGDNRTTESDEELQRGGKDSVLSLLYSETPGCETNTSSSFRPLALLSTSLINPGSRTGLWGPGGPQGQISPLTCVSDHLHISLVSNHQQTTRNPTRKQSKSCYCQGQRTVFVFPSFLKINNPLCWTSTLTCTASSQWWRSEKCSFTKLSSCCENINVSAAWQLPSKQKSSDQNVSVCSPWNLYSLKTSVKILKLPSK